ncbi:hypothetical protein ACF0H5_014447 [Mactra antiquata]
MQHWYYIHVIRKPSQSDQPSQRNQRPTILTILKVMKINNKTKKHCLPQTVTKQRGMFTDLSSTRVHTKIVGTI